MSQTYHRIITALGVLAAINVMALAAFIGWLFVTDRMDGDRFGAMKRLVLTPIAEERASREREEAEARDAVAGEIERVRLSLPPRTSAERAEEIDRDLDQAQIRRRLVEEEARLLGRSLDERFEALKEETLVESRRAEERRAALAAEDAIRSGAQFRKTVALLDSAPPKQAKEWMLELMRTGRRDDAVRYLDSMSRFAASRLMRELKSVEETALGADLLEALRRRTLEGGDDTP